MILENESLLDEIGLSDPDRLILTFFVAFEIGKGARSFWHPYFETTENTDLPQFWEEDDLNELEDELMKAEIKESLQSFKDEYKALKELYAKYPQLEEISQLTEETYKKAYVITITRCFGWSIPETTLIPLADCCNHFNIDNTYEIFNV